VAVVVIEVVVGEVVADEVVAGEVVVALVVEKVPEAAASVAPGEEVEIVGEDPLEETAEAALEKSGSSGEQQAFSIPITFTNT
jgi:hypothetical protein